MPRRKDAKKKRTQLDLSPEIRERLRSMSDELGIPMSQLAELFLEHGMDAVAGGEIDLAKYIEPTGNPQFWKFNLNLDKFRRDKKAKK